MDRVILENFD